MCVCCRFSSSVFAAFVFFFTRAVSPLVLVQSIVFNFFCYCCSYPKKKIKCETVWQWEQSQDGNGVREHATKVPSKSKSRAKNMTKRKIFFKNKTVISICLSFPWFFFSLCSLHPSLLSISLSLALHIPLFWFCKNDRLHQIKLEKKIKLRYISQKRYLKKKNRKNLNRYTQLTFRIPWGYYLCAAVPGHKYFLMSKQRKIEMI